MSNFVDYSGYRLYWTPSIPLTIMYEDFKNIPSIVLGRNLALVTKSKSGPNNASNARTTKENSNLEVTLN